MARSGLAIRRPSLSLFVTFVAPGLWDQYPFESRRKKWKSAFGSTMTAILEKPFGGLVSNVLGRIILLSPSSRNFISAHVLKVRAENDG